MPKLRRIPLAQHAREEAANLRAPPLPTASTGGQQHDVAAQETVCPLSSVPQSSPFDADAHLHELGSTQENESSNHPSEVDITPAEGSAEMQDIGIVAAPDEPTRNIPDRGQPHQCTIQESQSLFWDWVCWDRAGRGSALDQFPHSAFLGFQRRSSRFIEQGLILTESNSAPSQATRPESWHSTTATPTMPQRPRESTTMRNIINAVLGSHNIPYTTHKVVVQLALQVRYGDVPAAINLLRNVVHNHDCGNRCGFIIEDRDVGMQSLTDAIEEPRYFVSQDESGSGECGEFGCELAGPLIPEGGKVAPNA